MRNFSRIKSYLALHMLQESHLVQGSGASGDVHVHAQGIAVRGINRSFLIDLVGLANVLWRHIGPLFSQTDHSARVHQTIAELVGDLPLHAVQYPAGFVVQRLRSRGEYYQVLHVPPR